MNRDPRLCQQFVREAKVLFRPFPEVAHQWSIDDDEDHCFLVINGRGNPGYDIDVEVYPQEITLSAEGWHHHHQRMEPIDDFVAEILGRIRDMLSPAMRLRELSANGSPFRWYLETCVEGTWRTESESSLLFWNRFGRCTERTYTNTLLPARESHLGQ